MRQGWSRAAQRYLDGEGPPPEDIGERARADRLRAALDAYASELSAPGADVDRAVMAAVRAARAAGRRPAWRWLFESRVEVRPAFALAAAVALVVLSVAVTTIIRPTAQPLDRLAAGSGGEVAGTVLVRFEVTAPEAGRVALAGSFNAWSDSATPFVRNPASGTWTVTVALPPGEHQYLFVVDGNRWIPDPAAHAQVQDEFGQTNSVLVVGPRGVVRS
jgi:hypothetical protein